MQVDSPDARDAGPTNTPFRAWLAMLACAALAALAVANVASAADREHGGRGKRGSIATLSAEAFLQKVITLLAANDYADAWTSLYPGQQRLVPRGAYARCEGSSPIPGELGRIDVLDAHVEWVVVPGTGAPARRSTVVTFRLTFMPGVSGSPALVRVIAHALRTDGRWAWMLPAERLALHRSGRCGVGPVPAGPAA